MRFILLADIASRNSAQRYEVEAALRHRSRQQFLGEEIAQLAPIKQVLISASELLEVL